MIAQASIVVENIADFLKLNLADSLLQQSGVYSTGSGLSSVRFSLETLTKPQIHYRWVR